MREIYNHPQNSWKGPTKDDFGCLSLYIFSYLTYFLYDTRGWKAQIIANF